MFEHIHTRIAGRAPSVLTAFVAIAVAGCGESTVAPPVEEVILPGNITVATETSGFMKPDGYELFVDGVSAGTIGPNDELTLEDLDPATYELALGDVADNCDVEAVSVEVAPAQTAAATLSVICAHAAPQAYTLRFSRARPNLDDGVITECPFSLCPTEEEWDLYVHYNSQTEPHSVIRQNLTTGVEISHLPGVTLASLTEADVTGATFTAELVADPFDGDRVILIRTDLGAVYALGDPVENEAQQTLTFNAALVSAASAEAAGP
jgi:hypothetical protein